MSVRPEAWSGSVSGGIEGALVSPREQLDRLSVSDPSSEVACRVWCLSGLDFSSWSVSMGASTASILFSIDETQRNRQLAATV